MLEAMVVMEVQTRVVAAAVLVNPVIVRGFIGEEVVPAVLV